MKWFRSECVQIIETHSTNVVSQIDSISNKVDEYQKQTIRNYGLRWPNGQMAKEMKLAMKASTTTNALLTAEMKKKDTAERKTMQSSIGLPVLP